MGLGWGIIGYGWVARDFMIPAIIAAGGRVVAVADPSPEVCKIAHTNGFTCYDTAKELLCNAHLDAVYVATPNNCHAEAVILAAGKGIPILCEKPMAATLKDAEAMYAAVLAKSVIYGTAFDQRHHPAHKKMRELIQQGSIGTPTAIRIVYACWVDPAWSADESQTTNWRADPAKAGGGAVIDLALHGLDLAQMLLDEPLAQLSIKLQRRIHNYPVDDGGMLIGRSVNGILVSQHVAYNYAESLPRRRLEVVGETGMLTALDTMGQTPGGILNQQCGKTGKISVIPFNTTISPFTAQAQAFSEAVRGAPHEFCASRDIILARMFDAAYQEARLCL